MPDLELMPHQDKALTLTENFNRCAYYLDMGLGKTFVGAEKLYLLNNTVNLVICQKSKIDDWVQHFKEYYPDYHVLNLRKKSEVVTFRNELSATTKQLIGVVNYETAFRRDWLLKLKDFTLMLDESSLISNENAKRSKFILKMKTLFSGRCFTLFHQIFRLFSGKAGGLTVFHPLVSVCLKSYGIMTKQTTDSTTAFFRTDFFQNM